MADDFQYIKLPDGSYGKFLSTASDADIRSAISKDFPTAFAPDPTSKLGGVDMIRALAAKAMQGKVVPSTAAAPKTAMYDNAVLNTSHRAGQVVNALGNLAQGVTGMMAAGPANVPSMVLEQAAQTGVDDFMRRQEKRSTGYRIAAPIAQNLTGADVRGMEESSNEGDRFGIIAKGLPPIVAALSAHKVMQMNPGEGKPASPSNPSWEITKSIGPDAAGWDSLQGAIEKSHGDVMQYAKDNNLPINNRTDYANAARSYGEQQKAFYRGKVVGPIENEWVSAPSGYSGGTVGEGANATIGQLESRLSQINAEQANMRNTINEARSRQALSRQGELTNEAAAIRQTLNTEIAKRTGLTPEQVSRLRESTGAPFTIADQTMQAIKNETTKGVRQSRGTTTLPDGRVDWANRIINYARGGAVKIGDSQFMKAINDHQLSPSHRPTVNGISAPSADRTPIWSGVTEPTQPPTAGFADPSAALDAIKARIAERSRAASSARDASARAIAAEQSRRAELLASHPLSPSSGGTPFAEVGSYDPAPVLNELTKRIASRRAARKR